MSDRRREAPRPPDAANPPAIEGRVPPHDLDAEAAVMSAVFIDPAAFDKLMDLPDGEALKPEHFYSERHRRMFEACIELKADGTPIDIVNVGSWLKSRERLQQVGGMGYLTEVLNAAPAVANVGTYGQTVFDKWRARQIILTCQRQAAIGYGDYGPIKQYADETEQAIYALARVNSKRSLRHVRQPMMETFKKLRDAATRGNRITGAPTGFSRFDDMTAGLHPGDLTIIAARPGMGKTSFVLNVSVNVASPRSMEAADKSEQWEQAGVPVAIFSLEMPDEQLSNRLICSEARVDVSKVRTGGLSQHDWASLTQAAAYVNGLPLYIDDTSGITVLEIRAKVRRLASELGRPVGLVVVDYLQLMKGTGKEESREKEVSGISRDLKGLAKELAVPVIALSQLNRAVETRSEKNRRPQISDLRESGAIEQDADNIVFIYRDDYYNREKSEEPNVAELIVAKQRNGPTGTAKARFDRQYTRFDNLADGEYAEDEG